MEPTEKEKYEAMLKERLKSERKYGVSRFYEPVGMEGIEGPEDQPYWMFLPPEEAALARTVETAKARPGAEAASAARIRELGGPERWEDVGGRFRQKEAPTGPTSPVDEELKKKYEGLSPRARELQTQLGTQSTKLKEQADRYQVEADKLRERAANLYEQGKMQEAMGLEQMAKDADRRAQDFSAQAASALSKAKGERGWIGGRPAGLGPSRTAIERARTISAWESAAEEPKTEVLVPRDEEEVRMVEALDRVRKNNPDQFQDNADFLETRNRMLQEHRMAKGEPAKETIKPPGFGDVNATAFSFAKSALGLGTDEPIPSERLQEFVNMYEYYLRRYSGFVPGQPFPSPGRGAPGWASAEAARIGVTAGAGEVAAPATTSPQPIGNAAAAGQPLRQATIDEQLEAVRQFLPGYQQGSPVPPQVKVQAEQLLRARGLTAGA